jgi:hypothetical protein
MKVLAHSCSRRKGCYQNVHILLVYEQWFEEKTVIGKTLKRMAGGKSRERFLTTE